jgi:hypothetical protein
MPKTKKTPVPAKKTPAKPARKAAAKPARKPAAKKVKLQIGITPPELAEGTPAEKVFRGMASPKTRPSIEQIAKLPWMAQDRAYRVGYYMLTRGLTEAAAHPELEICNIPGAMLEASGDLLMMLGQAIINGELKLADGEVMLLAEDPLAVIGFKQIAPGKEGTVHDAPVLRIVFLA